MAKQTLIDIITEMRSVLWAIDDNDGELTPEIEAALDAAESSLSDKAQNICWFVDDLSARAATIKKRADALGRHAKSLDNRAANLKRYLFGALVDADIDRMPTADYPNLGIRNNPPKLKIENESLLMAKGRKPYLVKPPKPQKQPDRKAILNALKAGKKVPGCVIVNSKRIQW